MRAESFLPSSGLFFQRGDARARERFFLVLELAGAYTTGAIISETRCH